jgi:hypothetical protein
MAALYFLAYAALQCDSYADSGQRRYVVDVVGGQFRRRDPMEPAGGDSGLGERVQQRDHELGSVDVGGGDQHGQGYAARLEPYRTIDLLPQ